MTSENTLRPHMENCDFQRCADVWKAVPITMNRVQSRNECVLYATWNGIETLVGPLAAPPPFVSKLIDKTEKEGMLMRTLHERADFQRYLQLLGLKAQYTYQEYSRTKMGANAARRALETGVVLVGLKLTGQSGSLARADPTLPDACAHMTCIVGYLELRSAGHFMIKDSSEMGYKGSGFQLIPSEQVGEFNEMYVISHAK